MSVENALVTEGCFSLMYIGLQVSLEYHDLRIKVIKIAVICFRKENNVYVYNIGVFQCSPYIVYHGQGHRVRSNVISSALCFSVKLINSWPIREAKVTNSMKIFPMSRSFRYQRYSMIVSPCNMKKRRNIISGKVSP